jgi:Spy/CpxP family protein refolding chaperone
MKTLSNARTFSTPSVLSALAGAALLIGLSTSSVLAAGNAARVVPAPADAKECSQMVKDTKEMLAETEVTPEVDGQVEALIQTATAHCGASQFDDALASMMEARKLLGS